MCQLNICSKLLHKARKSPKFRKTTTFKLKVWDEDNTLVRYLRQLNPSDEDWPSAAEAVLVLAELYGARVEDCSGIVFKLALLLTCDDKTKPEQKPEKRRSRRSWESTLDSSVNISRSFSESKDSSLNKTLGEYSNDRIVGKIKFLTSSIHSTGFNFRGTRSHEILPKEYFDYTLMIAEEIKRPGRWFTGGSLLGTNLSPKRSKQERFKQREVGNDLLEGNAIEREAIFCSPLPPSSMVDSNDLKIMSDHTVNLDETPPLSPTSVDEIDDAQLNPDIINDCERPYKPEHEVEEVKELSDLQLSNSPIISTHVADFVSVALPLNRSQQQIENKIEHEVEEVKEVSELQVSNSPPIISDVADPESVALPLNRSQQQIERVVPLSNLNDQTDLVIENKQNIDDPLSMRKLRSSNSKQNNENQAAEQPSKSQPSNSRKLAKSRKRGKYYYTNMIYPGLKIPGIYRKRKRKVAKRKRSSKEADEEWKPKSRRRKLNSIRSDENRNSPPVIRNQSLNIEVDEGEARNEQERLVSPCTMNQSISTEQITFPEISIIPRQFDQQISDIESELLETQVDVKSVNASGFFNVETESWVQSESEINESSSSIKRTNFNLQRLKRTTNEAFEMAPDEGIVFRDLHKALMKEQCDVSPATAFLGVLICVSESGAYGPVMEISNPTKDLSLGNLVLRREAK